MTANELNQQGVSVWLTPLVITTLGRTLNACVRRQSIWDRLGRDLAECWPHLVSRS